MASGVVFLEICILAVCFYCGIVGQARLTTNTSSEDKRKWDYFMCSGEKKLTVLTSSDHECLESLGSLFLEGVCIDGLGPRMHRNEIGSFESQASI